MTIVTTFFPSLPCHPESRCICISGQCSVNKNKTKHGTLLKYKSHSGAENSSIDTCWRLFPGLATKSCYCWWSVHNQEAAQQEGIPTLHPQLHSSRDCQKTLNVLTGAEIWFYVLLKCIGSMLHFLWIMVLLSFSNTCIALEEMQSVYFSEAMNEKVGLETSSPSQTV